MSRITFPVSRAAACVLVLAGADAAAQDLRIVSQAATPAPVPAHSFAGAPTGVSTDERFVSFDAESPNLVANDTNARGDVFVRDRNQGTTERVSVATDGTQGNGQSINSSMSADGRLVVFQSVSNNLVAGDANNAADIFLRDRVAGTTTLLSRTATGTQGNGASTNPAISADGRFVAFTTAATNLFASDTNGGLDVVRLELATGEIVLAHRNGLTAGNGGADFASISADGRYILFASTSTNLVGGDTNATQDIFLFDAQTGTSTRVSVSDTGAQLIGASFVNPGAALSADGQRLVFTTGAAASSSDLNTLTDVYLRNVAAGTTQQFSQDLLVSASSPSLSGDGSTVCYGAAIVVGDEAISRVFVRNIEELGQSSYPSGPAEPISVQCGRFNADRTALYAMHSAATADNQTDWQMPRRIALSGPQSEDIAVAAPSAPVLAANGASRGGALGISDDGALVAFASTASNLVPGDTNGVRDIFVRDLLQGTTQLISRRGDGTPSTCRSRAPRISRNGRYVVFQSCGNLVGTDTNTHDDIYLFDRQTGVLTHVSTSLDGFAANGRSTDPSVANDGSVAFGSCASNLVDGDTNGVCDPFVRAPNGTVQRAAPPLVQPNGGAQAVRISASGRFVAFASLASNLIGNDSNNLRDIYVFDRQTDAIERVNLGNLGLQANAASSSPEFAADGRYVTFVSGATNLSTPTPPTGTGSLYVRDRQTGTTTLLSRSADGATAFNGNTQPTHRLSDDARFVAFCTTASNALPAPSNTARARCVRRDNDTGALTLLSAGLGGADPDNTSAVVAMNGTGTTVVFESFAGNLVADDLNGRVPDVFAFGAPSAPPPPVDPVFANGFEPQ